MRTLIFRSAYAAACSLLISLPSYAQLPADTLHPPQTADLSQLSFEKTSGCTHPFGLREGQNIEYQLLDAKGKATGLLRYRVLNISTDSVAAKKKKKAVATTSVRLKSGLYDLTNHVLQQQDLTYFCRRDTTFTDGLGEINYDGLKSFRDRLLAYNGSPLAWPNQPKAGSTLPNGGVAVQVSSPSVAIAKVNTTLRQRKVLAGPTSVKVPAGTFSCYAVESQRELATAARADLVLKNTGRVVDYYSPAIGIVKTEYYDKGGKLVQTKVLSRR
ncbi:MAG: hypothetical protein JWR44_1430 [Hymenobacter sp.]|jgi:hypothetical protein|nr:hypothetical protein [Hymenobacter sp.]